MAIYKAIVHSEYAQIPNSTLQDTSISFEARGVLAMLLSMPDSWEVHKSWVVSQSKAGKDKINSIFSELEESGYIRREEGQRKYGKFSSDDYFIFPTKYTIADLPQRSSRSGSTVDGESATIKETVKQNKHIENKHLNTCQPSADEPDLVQVIFDFWKSTMQKSNSTKLDSKRRMAIKNRINDGYDEHYIKHAIWNCSITPHNMGQNDRGQKYNDIELICRNASNLERFHESTPEQAQSSGLDATGKGTMDRLNDTSWAGKQSTAGASLDQLLDDNW